MSPIVDRVRKLIALAGSPNEHESRSAAAMACRLIREHGLHVDDPSPHRHRADREPRPRSAARRGPTPATALPVVSRTAASARSPSPTARCSATTAGRPSMGTVSPVASGPEPAGQLPRWPRA
ncbi:MAG: DUF2786 domain-containing protein [Deltaproteobacteria bacterium]|nr:DUF2786 domain-containing protein [Deltaproteobacteria bacterium]